MSRKLKLFAHYAPGWEDFLFLGTRGVLRDCGRARDRSELRWVALQQDFLGGFVILTATVSALKLIRIMQATNEAASVAPYADMGDNLIEKRHMRNPTAL